VAVPVISLYSDELMTGPAEDPPSLATTYTVFSHSQPFTFIQSSFTESWKYQQFRIFRISNFIFFMLTHSPNIALVIIGTCN